MAFRLRIQRPVPTPAPDPGPPAGFGQRASRLAGKLRVAGFVGTLAASGGLACATERLPDPRSAADAFAAAASHGDHQAMYRLLRAGAQARLGEGGVKKLAEDSAEELKTRGRRWAQSDAELVARIEVPTAGGTVVLALEEGRFGISTASLLPASAKTPTAALQQLQTVLARRSYPGLIRMLTRQTRADVERELAGLAEGLEDPEALRVTDSGNRATVKLPSGYELVFEREAGTWKLHDVR